jgi:basic membrane protein A and related proteins
MRKLATLIGVLLTIHIGLLFVRPRSAETAPAADALKIGIVFDVGGRGDKSFNDGAYAGALRARNELGATVHYIEPGESSDRESGLRLLAAEGMDLVVGVGFIFTDDLNLLAKEYRHRCPGQPHPAAAQRGGASLSRGGRVVSRRRHRRPGDEN